MNIDLIPKIKKVKEILYLPFVFYYVSSVQDMLWILKTDNIELTKKNAFFF